jgi:hypothetical protein
LRLLAGGAPLTFILDTSVGECQYKRTAALIGTFATNTTPVSLTFGANQPFERENANAFCPKTLTLDAKYTLETSASPFTGLTIS